MNGDTLDVNAKRVHLVFSIPSSFDAESFIDELVACYAEMNQEHAELVGYEWVRGGADV
jgi:hypothetical protein